MNLKSNMINNAIAGFMNTFKRGNNSFIVKRLSAFLLSLIIFVSSVFCQYCTALVSAAEVGAIVAVDLIVELAVTGGIVAGIMRGAQILQGEIASGYGFGSSGLDDYANNVNQHLIDGVNNGSISNAQAGTVNKLSGVPVEIFCPVYGIYQFLCTNELCNKIRIENPQTEDDVKQIVSAYWSSVNILDQRTFEEIASDPRNWVTSLDVLNYDSIGLHITSESIFDTYGVAVSEPDAEFFTTGKYAHATQGNWKSDYNITTTQVNSCNDFVFISFYSTYENVVYLSFGLYGHLKSENDPNIYTLLKSNFIGNASNAHVNELNGLSTLTLSPDIQSDLGFRFNSLVSPLDLSLIIDNWGEVRGIEATDAIDLIDWCWGDARFWNTDILNLAVDEIADIVDAQVDTGEGTGAIDVPIDLPIDVPIEGEGDVAWPGTDTEEDFDDPPAYPSTDEWADVDETDWPTFDPDPDDPDPDDPDPDDPDNPSVDPDGELPPLAVPQLLTLFPFCIPFDIHKALMFFETDMAEGGSPEFRIPFRIILPNNQSIIYDDIVINFDGYDIPLILYYIKAALVVTHCIVLGYATTKFIY